jgi:hypothetical protein
MIKSATPRFRTLPPAEANLRAYRLNQAVAEAFAEQKPVTRCPVCADGGVLHATCHAGVRGAR